MCSCAPQVAAVPSWHIYPTVKLKSFKAKKCHSVLVHPTQFSPQGEPRRTDAPHFGIGAGAPMSSAIMANIIVGLFCYLITCYNIHSRIFSCVGCKPRLKSEDDHQDGGGSRCPPYISKVMIWTVIRCHCLLGGRSAPVSCLINSIRTVAALTDTRLDRG